MFFEISERWHVIRWFSCVNCQESQALLNGAGKFWLYILSYFPALFYFFFVSLDHSTNSIGYCFKQIGALPLLARNEDGRTMSGFDTATVAPLFPRYRRFATLSISAGMQEICHICRRSTARE